MEQVKVIEFLSIDNMAMVQETVRYVLGIGVMIYVVEEIRIMKGHILSLGYWCSPEIFQYFNILEIHYTCYSWCNPVF